MADLPLSEGDTIIIQWGQMTHECQVWCSDELCHRCGGATIRLDPPWAGWKLLWCAECALTTTHVQQREALDTLQPGAVGMVSAILVRVSQKEKQEWLDV